ncbi:hypothetical protein GCM10025882_34770 [Acinetobacter gyllenbergii]|nr:hypothetical protein GCM10025882_34770 [Acinetobacter gyllenbergii]
MEITFTFGAARTGQRSWLLRYKKENGKWSWLGLGNYLNVTGNSEITLNRIHSVKSKDNIAPNTQRKIDDLFKNKGGMHP